MDIIPMLQALELKAMEVERKEYDDDIEFAYDYRHVVHIRRGIIRRYRALQAQASAWQRATEGMVDDLAGIGVTTKINEVGTDPAYSEIEFELVNERAEKAERERDALATDNTRLRGLVVNAEWNSYDLACSWCRYDVEFHHAPSCPAFSAPGVVRAYTPASPSADIGWQGAEGDE